MKRSTQRSGQGRSSPSDSRVQLFPPSRLSSIRPFLWATLSFGLRTMRLASFGSTHTARQYEPEWETIQVSPPSSERYNPSAVAAKTRLGDEGCPEIQCTSAWTCGS